MVKCPSIPFDLIDESIRDEMELLNDCGFCTVFSCSGTRDEHEHHDFSDSAYIAFDAKSFTKNKNYQKLMHLFDEQGLNQVFIGNGKISFHPKGVNEAYLKKGQNSETADDELKNELYNISEDVWEGMYPKLLKLCMRK